MNVQNSHPLINWKKKKAGVTKEPQEQKFFFPVRVLNYTGEII